MGSVEDDEVDADGKVRWDETDMGLRQPRLTLQANHAEQMQAQRRQHEELMAALTGRLEKKAAAVEPTASVPSLPVAAPTLQCPRPHPRSVDWHLHLCRRGPEGKFAERSWKAPATTSARAQE